MKIKTSELSGVALDWAVGLACGEDVQIGPGAKQLSVKCQIPGLLTCWAPSSNWAQGGDLFDRFCLEVVGMHGDCYAAVKHWHTGEPIAWWPSGETHLIAACLAVVAASLGDEVDVPEGLV